MTPLSIFGLIALIAGGLLIGMGMRASQTLTNKVVDGVTGHYPRQTMLTLIGGALLLLLGAALLYFGWHDAATPVISHTNP